MNRARYQRIRRVFLQARLQRPEEQACFLDAKCADDPGLRTAVERLLAEDDRPESPAEGSAGIGPPTSTGDAVEHASPQSPLEPAE